VVGIDVRRSYLRNGLLRILTGGNTKAAERSLLSIAFELYDWYKYLGYYRELRNSSSLALDEFHQDIVCYDGVRFPFADGSFDIVISNAVLEHVGNLDKLVEETSRITSSSGICYHLWHNFCSISGAHVPERLASEYPWGHLTGNRKVESHMRFMGNIVNRKSPYEIKESLEERFRPIHFFSVDRNHNKKGVDSDFCYEGEELLTEGLSSLLSSYSRDTLLTRGYLFIGGKKENPPARSTSAQ
jgi:SAM-dependent methyltransferase